MMHATSYSLIYNLIFFNISPIGSNAIDLPFKFKILTFFSYREATILGICD